MITFEVLGEPGRDNALLVRIDTGQGIERLLFDCGDGCLKSVSFSEIQAIDHLFFSHLHMDHVGGFDYFFRCVFNRNSRPNRIWGPPETGKIMQHRFQGFIWNLYQDMAGTWKVSDIFPDGIVTTRFELSEAFAISHDEGWRTGHEVILDTADYLVEAHTMDHRIPAIAYVVREKARRNIDIARLQEMGLLPGPWLQRVKDGTEITESIRIDDKWYSLSSLRQTLLVETPGDSIAYLTDFLLDEKSMEHLAIVLKGCDTLVCEGQYRHSDLELARKNFHMTSVLSAELAKRAEVGRLILFHLSDRYTRNDWMEMLTEARQYFPATLYPLEWRFDRTRSI